MHPYEKEFNTLVVIAQHLLNARSESRSAQRQVGGQGHLHEEIRTVAETLDDTIALAERAKRLMLHEWRAVEARQQAA